MKIKLDTEKDVQILVASEGVTVKDGAILRAGVGKLLKIGKNRIAVEIVGSDSLPDEVVRDLGVLDNLARELAGRVVIISENAALKKKLEEFSKPPAVLCFPNRKSAIAALLNTGPLDENKDKPVLPHTVSKHSQGHPFSHTETSESMRQAIVDRETGVLGDLRKQLADLEKENKLLHDRLSKLVENRRTLADPSAFTAKIRALELEVEKLLVPPKAVNK